MSCSSFGCRVEIIVLKVVLPFFMMTTEKHHYAADQGYKKPHTMHFVVQYEYDANVMLLVLASLSLAVQHERS